MNNCRLVAFFGVYLGIINNFNMPRVVRVNAMQAVLLDIVLMYVSTDYSQKFCVSCDTQSCVL